MALFRNRTPLMFFTSQRVPGWPVKEKVNTTERLVQRLDSRFVLLKTSVHQKDKGPNPPLRALSLSLSLFHSPFLPLSFSRFLFLAHMDNTLFNGPKVLEPFGRTETLASTRRDPSACSQNTNTNMLVSCASNVSSLVLVSRRNSAGVLYHGHKKRCNVCPLACPDRT